MKTRSCLITVALLLLAVSGVCADETKITVVYTEWAPYTYQEGGDARGFEIEILKAVANKMNIQAEFLGLPWKRCLKMLEAGNTDALVSLVKTPEREESAYFPQESISISRNLLFTKSANDIRYSGSNEDLRNYTIGVIEGFSYGSAFDKARYLKKDEAKDAEILIRKVLGGRNDVGVENQVVIKTTARRLGVEDQIRFLEPPIHAERLYVGFSKAKALGKMADDFSEKLAAFKKTDEYKAILEKYGIPYSDMTQR